MKRFVAAILGAAAVTWWAAPAAACSPVPPLTVADLTSVPPSEAMSAWNEDIAANPPVSAYQRLHFDEAPGSRRITPASISAVVRYWGAVPSDAGFRRHGGLEIDPTDSCGTPSGRPAGSVEFFVEFADGSTAEVSMPEAERDQDLAVLSALLGPPVDAADGAELLAASATQPADPTGGAGIGPWPWGMAAGLLVLTATGLATAMRARR